VKLARYAADGATFLGEVRYSNVRDLIQGSPKDDLLRLYLEGGNAAREIERQARRGALAMSGSSLLVAINALLLRGLRLPAAQ
jgi:hypothetical protein